MREITFRRPGTCRCPKDDLAVSVNFLGEPNESKYTVSISCTHCHRPVFIELSAYVESDDVPMRLVREAGSMVDYKLRLEASQ